MCTKTQPDAKHVESILFPRLDEGSTPSSSTDVGLDGHLFNRKTTEHMKAIKIVKIVGIAVVALLFVTLVSSGFFFEATHQATSQGILSHTDFDILQVETIIITALCTTYTLLLLPWLLYFMKIEKKSGLQYLSIYPMTSGRVGKIIAIALTFLNAATAIGFYLLYMSYTHDSAREFIAESQLAILTMLCFAIIFWGGTYLAYGSVYGAKRLKNIIKRKREKRKARREQTNS